MNVLSFFRESSLSLCLASPGVGTVLVFIGPLCLYRKLQTVYTLQCSVFLRLQGLCYAFRLAVYGVSELIGSRQLSSATAGSTLKNLKTRSLLLGP